MGYRVPTLRPTRNLYRVDVDMMVAQYVFSESDQLLVATEKGKFSNYLGFIEVRGERLSLPLLVRRLWRERGGGVPG